MRRFSAGVAAAALLGLFAQNANADFILDTGLPGGSGSPLIFGTNQFLAEEFSITAGQTVTQLAAYLTPGAGQAGESFTFDIFSATGFLNTRNLIPLASYSATFNGTGWNTANVPVSWTPGTGGDYWLAIETSSTPTLDAPVEAAGPTGTVPALGFAVAGSNHQFSASSAADIGLEITAVPLPAAGWLMLSGLGGLAALARRRRLA